MRIEHELQVRERILDLLPLVEPDAADDLVGDAGAPQRVFQRARLRVGAIQHRDRVLDVVVQRRARRPRDELGFVEIVAGAVIQNLRAAFALGIEPLVLAIAVLRDDGRRRVENDLCRSVVAFEPDDARLGEIVLEVEDVAQVGAAPFVDRLIRIADDAQVAVTCRRGAGSAGTGDGSCPGTRPP